MHQHHAAFDAGLISFDDTVAILTATALSQAAWSALSHPANPAPLTLTLMHRTHLQRHRASHRF